MQSRTIASQKLLKPLQRHSDFVKAVDLDAPRMEMPYVSPKAPRRAQQAGMNSG